MPETQLTEEASIAYQAFQKMRESKQIYFSFLQDIDAKYKTGGKATESETEELGKLLAVHDKNVMAFNDAMNAVENFEARDALIKLIS